MSHAFSARLPLGGVLLLANEGRLAALALPMVSCDFAALQAEPWALVVVDCDGMGGLETARAALGGGLWPAVVVSSEVVEQSFPAHLAAVELRQPVSGVALKVGVEHALRDEIRAL